MIRDCHGDTDLPLVWTFLNGHMYSKRIGKKLLPFVERVETKNRLVIYQNRACLDGGSESRSEAEAGTPPEHAILVGISAKRRCGSG